MVIPSVAFSLGLILSAIFTVFYFVQSHNSHVAQTEAFASRISLTIAQDLSDGDIAEVERQLSTLAPGKVVVVDSDGNRIAGTLPRSMRSKGKSYSIVLSGEPVGELIAVAILPYQPPMPYVVSVIACLAIAALAALVMHALAKLASRYIAQVTNIVNTFSIKSSHQHLNSGLVFSEFRKLNIATIRTTRRLVREIKSLRESAQYDLRTGLLNEHSLHEKIEKTLLQARFDRPSALVVVELNDHGRISENVRNTHSDQAIQAMAAVLKAAVNESEVSRGQPIGSWTIAALFSDQFAILVQDFGARDDLASFIRELQMAFRSPIAVADSSVSISLSGSIVVIPEDGDSVALIRQRAEATILDLKRQGKKGFSFYSPKLERQRDALLKLEAELRNAVQKDRFIPLFQPKIDLSNGRICGAEALARWRLDSGRLVSPSVFIELAEETGLINAIGEQIMRKACIETAQWNQLGHRLSIAVNVSPKQFERDGLSHMILDALAKSGLSPRQLEIEITESLAIQHPQRVRSVLKPLRKLGIKLAVDDFGTGHSNLATLTQLDFDVFKIDRQFVSGTPHDQQANAIVEMILSMASTLEMQIVGEGIETELQAKFLKLKGCHIGQGYLYSPPVTAEAFRKMLAEQPFAQPRLIA